MHLRATFVLHELSVYLVSNARFRLALRHDSGCVKHVCVPLLCIPSMALWEVFISGCGVGLAENKGVITQLLYA